MVSVSTQIQRNGELEAMRTGGWTAGESTDSVDVTIVIATCNRRELLEQTLKSLCCLEVPTGLQTEVIVCDDGSSDDTLSLIKGFENCLNLRFCYQPDKGYRPAAARNMGINLAKGRLILTLDSGVLAAPALLKEHLSVHGAAGSPAFVIGQTCGYRTPANDAIWTTLLAHKSKWWENILEFESLADKRTLVWESIGYRMDRLTVPWAHGWGNNVSMPRDALLAVGGYDESIVGWGPEDVDLACRLHAEGLQFHVSREALTLHLPHDPPPHARGPLAGIQNKWRIHAKVPGLATELLPCFYTQVYSERFDEVLDVIHQSLIPDYIDLWNEKFQQDLKLSVNGSTYILGAGLGDVANALSCLWMGDPDERKVRYAQSRYRWLEAHCCIGVNTGLASKIGGTAIITDYWRALPDSVVLNVLKEANRIARRVWIMYTEDFDVVRVQSAPAWNPERLAQLLIETGMNLAEIPLKGPTTIYSITQSHNFRT